MVAMIAPTKPKTREQELRAAIKQSCLSYAAREMYRALLDLSDWGTAHIPAEWQPGSLRKLAVKAGISERHAKRTLNELEAFGWVVRHRVDNPHRGDKTMYELRLGEKRARPDPVTGAERTKRWRQRKKAGQDSVTEQAAEAGQDSVTVTQIRRHEAGQVASHMPRSEAVWPGGREGGNVVGEAVQDQQASACDHRYKGQPPHFCIRCGEPAGRWSP